MRKVIVSLMLLVGVNAFALDLSGEWCSVNEKGQIADGFNHIMSIDDLGDYKFVLAGLKDYDVRTKQEGLITQGSSGGTMEPSIINFGDFEEALFTRNGRQLRLDFENGRLTFKKCPKKWSGRINQIFQ